MILISGVVAVREFFPAVRQILARYRPTAAECAVLLLPEIRDNKPTGRFDPVDCWYGITPDIERQVRRIAFSGVSAELEYVLLICHIEFFLNYLERLAFEGQPRDVTIRNLFLPYL